MSVLNGFTKTGNGIHASGVVSAFGGKSDYDTGQDSGNTACGPKTYDPATGTDRSNEYYCALPSSVWSEFGLSCLQSVTFTYKGKSVTCQLWDKGPAVGLPSLAIADISPGAMKALGGTGLAVMDIDIGATGTGTGGGTPDVVKCKATAQSHYNTSKALCSIYITGPLYDHCVEDCQKVLDAELKACDSTSGTGTTVPGNTCADCALTNVPACIACVGVNLLIGVLIIIGVFFLFQEEIKTTAKEAIGI